MRNPPNGRPPKSFDTNKKKRLFSAGKKTFGNHRMGNVGKYFFAVSRYYQRTYVARGRAPAPKQKYFFAVSRYHQRTYMRPPRPQSDIFNPYRTGRCDQL